MSSEPRKKECPICLSVRKRNRLSSLPGCGHIVCNRCLKKWFYEQLATAEARRHSPKFTCPCSPGGLCQTATPERQTLALKYLEEKDQKLVSSLESRQRTLNERADDQVACYCPVTGCLGVVLIERPIKHPLSVVLNYKTSAKCPECHTKFTPPQLPPRFSPGWHVAWAALLLAFPLIHDIISSLWAPGDPDIEKSEQYIDKHARRCPRSGCYAPIIKTEGCNHMICPQCRTEFCWACLQVLSYPHSCPGYQVLPQRTSRPSIWQRLCVQPSPFWFLGLVSPIGMLLIHLLHRYCHLHHHRILLDRVLMCCETESIIPRLILCLVLGLVDWNERRQEFKWTHAIKHVIHGALALICSGSLLTYAFGLNTCVLLWKPIAYVGSHFRLFRPEKGPSDLYWEIIVFLQSVGLVVLFLITKTLQLAIHAATESFDIVDDRPNPYSLSILNALVFGVFAIGIGVFLGTKSAASSPFYLQPVSVVPLVFITVALLFLGRLPAIFGVGSFQQKVASELCCFLMVLVTWGCRCWKKWQRSGTTTTTTKTKTKQPLSDSSLCVPSDAVWVCNLAWFGLARLGVVPPQTAIVPLMSCFCNSLRFSR